MGRVPWPPAMGALVIMYIKDGTRIKPLDPAYGYDYEPDKTYVAIGWQQRRAVPMPTGEVPGDLVNILSVLAYDLKNKMRGLHFCTFCNRKEDFIANEEVEEVFAEVEGRPKLRLGSAEVWVPGSESVVFCAPNLVIHYIRDHGYKPPQEFIDAVMKSA